MGKQGFSDNDADVIDPGVDTELTDDPKVAVAADEWRCFTFGENNFMINGHTRSFNKKLNSGC